VDPEVQTTRSPYGYVHSNPLSYGDPTGDESPTPEEIEFSNWYQHIEGVTVGELKRKHASTEEVDEYREVASYYYFALKSIIAYNDDNYEYAREDQKAWEGQYARLAGHIAGDFAPLVKAEYTKGWAGAIKYLAELTRKILHERKSCNRSRNGEAVRLFGVAGVRPVGELRKQIGARSQRLW